MALVCQFIVIGSPIARDETKQSVGKRRSTFMDGRQGTGLEKQYFLKYDFECAANEMDNVL